MNASLLGSVGDETRLLVFPETGYSVPLPGHPELITLDPVTVQLRDVNVSYTFTFDEAPAEGKHDDIARAQVAAFAEPRVRPDWRVAPRAVHAPLRPAAASGAAEEAYPVRGTEPLVVEHVWVAVRPTGSTVQVLRRITRYLPSEFLTMKWNHLRTSFSAHHHWDPAALRTTTPTIWPPSWFALPGVTLELTEPAWQEAQAKAHDLGVITQEQLREFIDTLNHAAAHHFSPTTEVPEILKNLYPSRLYQIDERAADILLRGFTQCVTVFDLRAWAWQCAWALGNRSIA